MLLAARIEQIESGKRIEELYSTALEAMRTYSGQEIFEMEDDQDL